MASNLINKGRQGGGRGLRKAPEGDPAAVPVEGHVGSGAEEAPRAAGAKAASPVEVVQQFAKVLPAPYEARSDAPELAEDERRDLATCEAALDHLRLAFWIAGRALQVIRDARLYRATHGTFEDYCLERWGMSRPHAYRLIAEWSLAERLLSVSPIGDKMSESHVRVLLPLAATHGEEAAEVVFVTVAETSGQVTAELLRGAASVVPEGPFDRAAAIEQIRAFLAGGVEVASSAATATTAAGFERQATRARDTLEKLAKRVTRSGAADPGEVRKFVEEMRALLDKIELKTL
ncbi:hypothetical protein [Microtetraspora malaysiensis]|uniref:hypothetical protein n=1 Tax=Microtetraspora malaysiensis TaxID=161358 RepID=UPI003D8B88DB